MEDVPAECTVPELCLEVFPILVHVDTAGGRCLMSRTQEPGWVSLVLTQRGHVGDAQEGEMTLVKKFPEKESCVSIRMGITGQDSSKDVGMAGCGWEKWTCGFRLPQELRKCLKNLGGGWDCDQHKNVPTRVPGAVSTAPHQLQHTRAGSGGACSGAGLGDPK